MTKARAILFAVGIVVLVTALSTILAWFLYGNGAEGASRAVFWPNTLLQAIFPSHNIGTAEQPVYEATPVQFLAFLLSFPFGAVAYSAVAYAWLAHRTGARA
jgi:hypothetical protein